MKFSLTKTFRFLSIWLPLCAGTLLTALIAILLHSQNQEDDKAHIELLMTQAESIIQERFALYEYGLRGARGSVVTAGPDKITRKQFENYIGTRDITREFPGALGFGFIRRVPVKEEQRFLEMARQDGMPDFSVRSLNPHDSDRFVIQYIYPIAPNKQAIGLDIGSETNRRNAALASARENRAYLSEPITLVQADKKARRGVLIMLPIFPNDFTMQTPEAREQNVVGWSYAPLIIDDVLAGLSLVIDHAQVQLSNQNESTPFYISDGHGLNYHLEDKMVRVINVMGQEWKLEIVPNDEAYMANRWDIHWVIIIGMGLTLLLVLSVNFLRTNAGDDFDENREAYRGVQSVLHFLRSSNVRKTWPTAIVTMLAVFFLISWQMLERQKSDLANELSRNNHEVKSNLEEIAAQYSRDTLFLANTPPVIAMLQMESQDMPLVGRALKELWRERMTEIFKAYMQTSQEVFQVRLITEENNWKEQVKVQREGSNLIVFNDADLQDKSSEPYISQTLSVGDSKVYVSDINLNREYGIIETPHRPVWRFSTPLYFKDGKPFGLIIINLNATAILDEITLGNIAHIQSYITNSDGSFIVHPEPSQSFAFENGNPVKWSNEFLPVEPTILAITGANEYAGNSGDIWAVDSMFNLDTTTSPRHLNIYTTSTKLPFIIRISWQFIVLFFAILIFVFVSVVIQYWLWMSALVSQREKWNHQLQRQQTKELSRFKALLESSPEATLIVDQTGIVKMVNAEAEKVFGLSRSQLENNSIDQLIPLEFRGAHSMYLNAYMNNPENRRMAPSRQLFALKGTGEKFPVEISLSAVPMEDDLLVSVSLRDITERLKIEKELKVALQEAENATRAKSAFLANTSHEIRTPLNAIIGLTHMFADESLTETQRLLIDKISLSGKSLLGIVNDVLDLSKIEADEMSLELLPVNLRDFSDEISGVFTIQAEQKKIEFALVLSRDLPDWVEADPLRLKQILNNLLSNALKFTDIGKISFNVELKDTKVIDDKPQAIVRFSVTDSGVGISQENLSRLFKPFSQADASTTRRYGGTGLGLSIVSQLVGLMDGEIAVKSEEGKGSTFWVDIPFSVISADEIELAGLQNQQMLYLIVAENDEQDAKQIMSLTRSLGWRADLVNDGNALVELFIERQEHGLRLPDALIVDWKMPDLDGVQTLEKLAHQIEKDKLPAVLMVSDIEKQQLGQFDDNPLIAYTLQKPVSASTLFDAVNDTVCRFTGDIERVLSATTTAQIKAKWLSNSRILVVDDSETNLEVAKYLLTQAGADVETANSADTAINKLKADSSNYDAVLMDVQMPVMDGLSATKHIRQSLGMTELPIIALTAGALVEERKRAFEAGMNDFLTKPISPAQLISVLRTHISKPLGTSIEADSIDMPLQSEDSWPAIKGLNLAQAKQLLMNNKELFFNTLQHLLEDNENLLSDKAIGADSLDNPETRESLAAQAHKLRSSAGMVGAQRLHTLASSAENTLREPDTNAENVMQELVSELKELNAASKAAIMQWKQSQEISIVPSTIDNEASLDAAIELLKMFNQQDLNALTLVEEEKEHLFNLLGRDKFNSLLDSTKRLNFTQAKEVLEPFVLSSRKDNG
jgi:PAS domain S-box-containing protein